MSHDVIVPQVIDSGVVADRRVALRTVEVDDNAVLLSDVAAAPAGRDRALV